MYKVTINYNDDIDEVVVYGKKTLLLELEELGVLAKYNCRQGHCGVCIAKLLSGEVTRGDWLYPTNNNEILICQSRPITDINIQISN